MLVYIRPVILLLCMPRNLPIEHTSSMHRHTSMLMQSTYIMHVAIENKSSTYTRAILNVKCHRSFVHTHADTRAILNTCRVV